MIIAVIKMELLVTLVAGIVFLILFAATSDGVRSPDSGVRAAYWHLMAVTVAGMADMAVLLALSYGVKVPLLAVAVVYGLGALVVIHRVVMVTRAACQSRPGGGE